MNQIDFPRKIMNRFIEWANRTGTDKTLRFFIIFLLDNRDVLDMINEEAERRRVAHEPTES